MKKQNLLLILPLIVITAIGCPQHDHSSDHNPWISLFNEQNLDGWIPKFNGHPPGKNPDNIFRVVDGAITVTYQDFTPPPSNNTSATSSTTNPSPTTTSNANTVSTANKPPVEPNGPTPTAAPCSTAKAPNKWASTNPTPLPSNFNFSPKMKPANASPAPSAPPAPT